MCAGRVAAAPSSFLVCLDCVFFHKGSRFAPSTAQKGSLVCGPAASFLQSIENVRAEHEGER
jgi:hypothetical protein